MRGRTSTTPPPRRCARPRSRRCCRSCASTTPTPVGSTPRGGRPAVALEDAREQVAALLGARPREVVFTSSGTEAGQHRRLGRGRRAPIGAGARRDDGGRALGRARRMSPQRSRSDRGRCRPGSAASTRRGARCGPVRDRAGRACSSPTTRSARSSPRPRSPRRAVSAACSSHVDACMAAGHVPVDFGALGADLCSVSAHKFGGPKGAGALLVRRGLRLPPFVVGGAQERARRGGLEDVPGDGRLRRRRRRALRRWTARRRGGRAARGSTDRVARRRSGEGRRRDALRRSRRPGPASRVPRRRGRRSGADPARARPARRGGALGLGVLERGARAVADPGGHGRRRRPLTPRQRRLELDTRATSKPSSTPSPPSSTACVRLRAG